MSWLVLIFMICLHLQRLNLPFIDTVNCSPILFCILMCSVLVCAKHKHFSIFNHAELGLYRYIYCDRLGLITIILEWSRTRSKWFTTVFFFYLLESIWSSILLSFVYNRLNSILTNRLNWYFYLANGNLPQIDGPYNEYMTNLVI